MPVTSTQYSVFLFFFSPPCTKCATSTQNGVFRSTSGDIFYCNTLLTEYLAREEETSLRPKKNFIFCQGRHRQHKQNLFSVIPTADMDAEEALSCLHRLEEEFLGTLTDKIGRFMQDEAAAVNSASLCPGVEQSAETYALFLEYRNMVEAALHDHLVAEGLSAEELAAMCAPFCANEGDGGEVHPLAASLSCVEYILAVTEYSAFTQLLADHQACQQWEGGDEMLVGGLED